jgi:hypothetical protein
MLPVSPVVIGQEQHEILYAAEQPEYMALPALRLALPEAPIVTRWRPTAEERAAIANGADVVLTQLTFRMALQPVSLQIVMPDAIPQVIV